MEKQLLDDSKPQMRRVLHLIDSGGFYGAERVLLELMMGQCEQGIEPILFSVGLCEEGEKAIEAKAAGLGLKVLTWRGKAGFNASLRQRLFQLSESGQYDVLHSHGYKFDLLLASLAFKRRQALWASTVHGYVVCPKLSKMSLYQWLDKRALRCFDRVVCVSEAMRHTLKPLPVHCIVNGIGALPSGGQLSPKVEEFLAERTHCLMIVGRLATEKGHVRLINALSKLTDEYPGVGLVVFGEGPLLAELQGLVNALGLEQQVLFYGYCDNIAAHFPLFDLLAMPSDTEGLPITLLEAVDAEIPLVASAVGGIPEVLGSDYPGLCAPDEASLIEALRRQLDSPPDLTARQMLRQRTQNRFGYQRMAQNYLQCYTQGAKEVVNAHA